MVKFMAINSLISSLFVYNMSVLENLTKDLIIKYDKMISNFLWDNKKAKILMAVLHKPKEIGGLRLVNLKAKQDSLKIQ